MIPIDRATLVEAARLRAAIAKLRTPDAIHVATASLSGASTFLSNDDVFRGLNRIPHGLGVVLLDDLSGP